MFSQYSGWIIAIVFNPNQPTLLEMNECSIVPPSSYIFFIVVITHCIVLVVTIFTHPLIGDLDNEVVDSS